jgi:uncharacterized peroxidase-related enzyme
MGATSTSRHTKNDHDTTVSSGALLGVGSACWTNHGACAQNFLNLLQKSAPVAEAYAAVQKLLAAGQLTAHQREQIALTVGEINDSRYCLAAHSAIGRDVGLSEDDIWLARKAGANDAKAEAMLRFTQAVALQRGRVSHEDLVALRGAGFSDAQLIEILANVALNVFTNYVNILFKTQVDFLLLHPEIRQPKTATAAADS